MSACSARQFLKRTQKPHLHWMKNIKHRRHKDWRRSKTRVTTMAGRLQSIYRQRSHLREAANRLCLTVKCSPLRVPQMRIDRFCRTIIFKYTINVSSQRTQPHQFSRASSRGGAATTARVFPPLVEACSYPTKCSCAVSKLFAKRCWRRRKSVRRWSPIRTR